MSADADMTPMPVWKPGFPDSKDNRFQNLALSLSRTTLTDLPWSIKRNMLTTLSLDTSVYDALQILTSANIHSAPVFDVFGKFYGFTDMQQLTRYVVRVCNGETAEVFASDGWWEKQTDLKNTEIRDLIRAYKTSRPINGEFAWPISEYSSLYQVFERMAREGQHRMAIEDTNNKVVGICTQSMLLNWIKNHMSDLGTGKNAKIEELRPYQYVATIRNTAKAIRAFEIMDSKQYSLNGVGVVDAGGKLVDVISTFDLRGILPGSWEFGRLYDSVTDFKAAIRRKFPGTCYFPRVVRQGATLETLITMMAKNKLHRVFVVDAHNRPLDCISQTDVLRFCLDAMSARPTWW